MMFHKGALSDLRRNIKKLNLREIWGCTLVPLLLPCIFNIPDNWDILGDSGKWLVFAVGFIVECYIVVKHQLRHSMIKTSAYEDKAARRAYSKAYSLMEKKKEYIISKSYDTSYSIPREMIPYDVHGFLGAICNEFRNTISEITHIHNEYMSVSFIYRYVYSGANEEDGSWRWIVGKESATSAPLNDYVNAEDTVFHMLVYGTADKNQKTTKFASVFANEKTKLEAEKHYHMSTRDLQHNKVGSIFSTKIVFGNNATNFVESILTVSSYGKRFVESSTIDDHQSVSADELQIIIIEELLPYYQRLIESELGILYLRHAAP